MAGPKDPLRQTNAASNNSNGASKKDDCPEPLVIQAINKRLRNTRKRLRGIEEIQAKVASGKELNPDQEAALLSKPAVLATIEELEKLLKVVKEPLQQDLDAAASKARAEAKAAAAKAPPPKPVKSAQEWQREKQDAVSKASIKATADAMAAAAAQAKEETKAAADTAVKKAIDTLMDLMYFSAAFDPYSPFLMERHVCASYANQSGVALAQEDIDLIGILGKLFTTRPYAPPMSHATALNYCHELARNYVLNPENVLPHTSYTGKHVQEKIEIIKSMPYCEMLPGVQQGAMNMPHASYPQTAPPAPAPAPAPVAAAPQPLPTPIPTPIPSMVTPNTAQVSGENLVTHFFGAAMDVQPLHVVNPPLPDALPLPNGMHTTTQQQQQNQQHPHADLKGTGCPPAFGGDAGLGIEGVDYEDVHPRGTETPAIQAVHANVQNSQPGSGAPSSNGQQPHNGRKWRRGRNNNRSPKPQVDGSSAQGRAHAQAQGHSHAQAAGGGNAGDGSDGRRREGGGRRGGGGRRERPRNGPDGGAGAPHVAA